MRLLKKLLLFMICFVIGINSISAMTKEELKNKLTKAYTVNGEKYSIDETAKVLAARYLNQYEVSSKDAKYISDRIDEAVSIIQADGHTNMKDFSKSSKEKLKKLVEKVSANTSVKATVMKNSVVVYTPDGEKFAEVDRLVKQTGIDTNLNIAVISLSLVILLAGTIIILRKSNI